MVCVRQVPHAGDCVAHAIHNVTPHGTRASLPELSVLPVVEDVRRQGVMQAMYGVMLAAQDSRCIYGLFRERRECCIAW